MTTAHINKIATAVPPHDVHRAFVAFARTLLETRRDQSIFDRMVERSGIEHRFSVLPAARDALGGALDGEGVYTRDTFPTTATRMRLFEREAPRLVEAALGRLALEEEADRITHVVVSSCTGLYAPGLDHAIVRMLGLRGSVERTMVGFMGCSAGVNALKLAHHFVRSTPSSRVLVVNLELCSLHMQGSSSVEKLLSFLLFSDGCAASLVTADEVGLALDSFAAVSVPDSADLITWHIGDSGFDMHLSGRVPAAIAAGLDGSAATLLGGARPSAIDHWAVHPGGRSVLDGVERGLGLDPHALDVSRDVLARFGNMSSATIGFVLEAVLRDAHPGERGCGMAFGPGLCAETFLFHKV